VGTDISRSKKIQNNEQERSLQQSFVAPSCPCGFPWRWLHPNFWVSLWCTGEVTGTHSCRRLICCARTSPFSTTMPGPNCHSGLWLIRAQVVDHPSYSFYLEPSNLHIIGLLKKHLRIKRFAVDADAKQAVTSWLQTLHKDLFYVGIQALVPRWDQCQWRHRGGLMRTVCYPCAIYT
jgi:hypothetical protein